MDNVSFRVGTVFSDLFHVPGIHQALNICGMLNKWIPEYFLRKLIKSFQFTANITVLQFVSFSHPHFHSFQIIAYGIYFFPFLDHWICIANLDIFSLWNASFACLWHRMFYETWSVPLFKMNAKDQYIGKRVRRSHLIISFPSVTSQCWGSPSVLYWLLSWFTFSEWKAAVANWFAKDWKNCPAGRWI